MIQVNAIRFKQVLDFLVRNIFPVYSVLRHRVFVHSSADLELAAFDHFIGVSVLCVVYYRLEENGNASELAVRMGCRVVDEFREFVQSHLFRSLAKHEEKRLYHV